MPDLSKLYACPICKKPNYTRQGLRAHICKSNDSKTLTKEQWLAVVDGSETALTVTAPQRKPGRVINLSDLDVLPAAPATAEQDEWSVAIRWTQTADGCAYGTLVAQCMAGFELIELYKKYGVSAKGGRPKKLPNGSEVSETPLSWPELVKQKLGKSDDTARNWMNMAKAIRPRLKKLEGPWEAPTLLALPPSEWPEDAREAIATTLRGICEGQTQAEFMQELGLVKRPSGHAIKNGNGGFHPNNALLQGWLAEAHPELAGQDYDSLPEEVQAEYRKCGKRYEERLTKEQKAELERAWTARAWRTEIPPALAMGLDEAHYAEGSQEELEKLRDLAADLSKAIAAHLASRKDKALPTRKALGSK